MLTRHITLRIPEDMYEWLTDQPEPMAELIRRLIEEKMDETLPLDN